MSKKHIEQSTEHSEPEGGDIPAEHVDEVTPEEVQEEPAKPQVLGIGQFVRHLLRHSTKSNAEILELVLKTFEGSKTTPACIAWYKTDLRKKGLLDGHAARGKNKLIEISQEELDRLCA
jgi:hypothetical protein